jgi:hypothetical protein
MQLRNCVHCALAVGLLISAPSHAVPVNTLAVADASMTIVINDGEAVDGVEIIDGPLPFNVVASSSLDAPDAVNTNGESTVIAGLDPADPSEFIRFDRTRRNADSEGGDASVSYFVYGIRKLSPDPALANPLVENGAWGTSQSTAQITTEPFDTSASAEAPVDREFNFTNVSADEVFFTIAGDVALTTAVQFNGAAGSARAFADVSLLFASADALDISFSGLAPYSPKEDSSGDNAFSSLTRFTDPMVSGRVGLTAFASALGVDAIGAETASAMATDEFLLGVTLQPGQEMTMTRRFSVVTSVVVEPVAAVVPVPGIAALLLAGLLGIRFVRCQPASRR